MTEPKKIMIVDDHTIMRDGLQALLSSEPNYEVVGTVADGKTAIQSVATLHPDIILMDLTMPGTSGIEAIEHIKRRHPRVPDHCPDLPQGRQIHPCDTRSRCRCVCPERRQPHGIVHGAGQRHKGQEVT